MPDSAYSGSVRILDTNGILLTVGTASLETDDNLGTWTGTIEVVAGTGVAGKALVVYLEIDGRRGMSQLVPIDNDGATAHLTVVGLGAPPF
ncbi:MAG: hypothetical protein ACRDWH_03355 [Acidimicrobiia bacterium]